MSKIEFENGSVVVSIEPQRFTRGKRAEIKTFIDDDIENINKEKFQELLAEVIGKTIDSQGV